MSDFIVSARKYRPATFASVIGQGHITSTLRNAIERGQLAHAYLFCGPRGVGKTTCARIFAKAINCLSPNGAEACNECESCRSFNQGRSLNIHELDAASNNSVDDIRSLIEQVRIIPQIGRYSLFIIDEVHMLSPAAFNAFLKTLEEPPAHAIFILATTEKHKIIPTILSRCQIYDFNRIRVEDGVEYLKFIAAQEGVNPDEESLNLIAQKADGGMRDALSMFDKAVSFCGKTLNFKDVAQTLNVLDYDTYFTVTELLLAGNYADTLVLFDEVLSKGFSGQTFCSGLNRHMRDLLMAKRPETLRLIEMTGTLLERYRTQAGACSVEPLFGAISILTELDGKIRQSSNQRLLVELGLMKISGLGQKKNDDLVLCDQYSLPELLKAGQGVDSAPVAQATVAVSQTNEEVEAVETQRVVVMEAVAEKPLPVIEREPEAAEKSETLPAPESHANYHVDTVESPEKQIVNESEKPIYTPTPAVSTPAMRGLISGASIAELLASTSGVDESSDQGDLVELEDDLNEDPDCALKLEMARERILDLIKERRPRFVPSFELMTFSGNAIQLITPTQELREEILRNKTAMLLKIAQIAGVVGIIELEVTVNETIQAVRPFKLEDRIRHMHELNPLVIELRRALDLEAE